MSDTTTTITPKTKTILRDMQGCAMGWVPGTRLLGNSRAGEICTAIDQVLTALEAAEASAEKAEDYAEKLVYAVTDGNLSNSYDVQVVADEVSRIWQSYTNQKVAAVRAEAEAESARLRAELVTAQQVAASAQSVAEAAWGGEIPSPLPGHKHMTEDDLASMCAHLDCPLCGGSGHIGDCDATVASEVSRLQKMVEWLAEISVENERDASPDNDYVDPETFTIAYWVEAASRAVAAGEGE